MEKLTRRDVLKGALATTGALLLANMPGWKKPAVHVGTVPVFAQTSLGTGDLQVTLTWNTGSVEPPEGDKADYTDLDLHVFEPSGFEVYFGDPIGPTATLDHDNTYGFGPENIFVAPGMSAAGTYDVNVDLWGSTVFPTTATIRVTSFANTAQQKVKTYTYTFVQPEQETKYEFFPYICSIDFPSGNIYVVAKKDPRPRPTGTKK
jgi:hypothetical protein